MKYIILPAFAVAMLTSCGGSSSTSSDSENQEMSAYDQALAEIKAEEAQKESKAKAMATTVPVINSQFDGIIAGKLEVVDKNIELVPQKTGTTNWDGESLYAITATQAVKVLEGSDLSSIYAIELDLLDENGVTIGSIESGYDDNNNLEKALNDGSIGKAFKISFKSEDGMTLDEAGEILKSVKSVSAGTSSGDDKARESVNSSNSMSNSTAFGETDEDEESSDESVTISSGKTFFTSAELDKFVSDGKSGDIDRMISAMEWYNNTRKALKPDVRKLDEDAIKAVAELEKASEDIADQYGAFSVGGALDNMSNEMSNSQKQKYAKACANSVFFFSANETMSKDSQKYDEIYRKYRYGSPF